MTTIASAGLDDLGAQLMAWLPTAASALALLIVGLILASLLRRATVWMVRTSGLEAFLETIGAATLIYKLGFQSGA